MTKGYITEHTGQHNDCSFGLHHKHGHRHEEYWVDPSRTNGKDTHPYSYSEFFVFKTLPRDDVLRLAGNYSDRLWQRDVTAFEAAVIAAGKVGSGQRFDQYTARQASAFLSAYWDKPIECVALAEGCNVSNGYPYWIFWYRDAAP